MRVSAKSDYAIRVLVELAADQDRPLTCESIAQSQDIPYRFLKSVVRDLRQAGLVRSQRGCEGGYWLARDAESISVAEVVEAIDGELLSVHGVAPAELDYPAPADTVPALWSAVEDAARQALSRISIATLRADSTAPVVTAAPN